MPTLSPGFKKFAIIAGIVLSTLTAIVSGINEFSSFAKDWLTSDSNNNITLLQAQVEQLNVIVNDQSKLITNLNSEVTTMQLEINKLAFMPLTMRSVSPKLPSSTNIELPKCTSSESKESSRVTLSSQSNLTTALMLQSDSTLPKPTIKKYYLGSTFSWVGGIAGILGLVIFTVLHFVLKKKETK